MWDLGWVNITCAYDDDRYVITCSVVTCSDRGRAWRVVCVSQATLFYIDNPRGIARPSGRNSQVLQPRRAHSVFVIGAVQGLPELGPDAESWGQTPGGTDRQLDSPT